MHVIGSMKSVRGGRATSWSGGSGSGGNYCYGVSFSGDRGDMLQASDYGGTRRRRICC